MNRRIPLALVLALAASPAVAQPSTARPDPAAGQAACPGGDMTTVRVSRLKPGGTAEGLRKAMADHARWYADHGYAADRFAVGQVMVYDPALRRRAPAKDRFVTLHSHSSDVPRGKQDAAWAAFVAQYAANSSIESTTVVCMIQ